MHFIFRTLLLFLFFIITLFNVTKNMDIYVILNFGKFSLVIASGNLHLKMSLYQEFCILLLHWPVSWAFFPQPITALLWCLL